MALTRLFKEKTKELLWKIGLRDTLPASTINHIKISENNEVLVNIRQDNSLFFSKDLENLETVYLRKTVYEKLKCVQKLLPQNYYLKIYSAYRSLEEQTIRWNKKLADNQKKYPELSSQQLESLTKNQVADPRSGFGGHQTGGAVDLTLCNISGTEYDMGSTYSATTPTIKTNNKKITITQRKNREILKMCMEKAGFKNYPNEWWHYCYGDRMWSAYSSKKECFYGLVKKQENSK